MGERCSPMNEMTSEEHELIETLERLDGRSYTDEEVYLALEQARAVGELD